MKKFLLSLFALTLLIPAVASATTGAPWSITNLTDTFIFPNQINGSAKGILISASSTINGKFTVSTSTTGCASFGGSGLLFSTGVSCGTGSGGGFGEALKIVNGTYLTSTSTTIQGIIASASSTIGGGTQVTGLTISGGATTSGSLLVQGSATTSNLSVSGVASTTNLTISSILSCGGGSALTTNTSGVVACGAISGTGQAPFTYTTNFATLVAATSSILWAQNGIQSSSTVEVGTGAAGNAIARFYNNAAGWTTGYDNSNGAFEISKGVTLGTTNALAIDTTTLKVTTLFGSSTAQTITNMYSTNASTTNLTVQIPGCSGTNALTTTAAGFVQCGAITGSGGTFSFTPTVNYGVNTNATGTIMNFTAGIQASSTSHLVNLDFNSATSTGLSYFQNGLISQASSTFTAGLKFSGQIKAIDACTSSLTPCYSDTVGNTGLYFPAAGQVGLTLATAQALLLTSSGLTLQSLAGSDGLVKSTAGLLSVATAGTDYQKNFDWTPTTNYAVNTNATSTPIFMRAGLFASSTSSFDKINIGSTTSGTMATSTDFGNFVVSGNASTTQLTVSSAGGAAGCATFSASGQISNTGTACGTGSGSIVTEKWATSTNPLSGIYPNTATYVGIGTTSPFYNLTLSSSTAAQLALTDGSNTSAQMLLRNSSGDLYFATSSPATFATSSMSTVFVVSQSGSACIGISCSATTSQGTLVLRDQNGNGPALFMGGNGGGDSDWFLRRYSNNDAASNDRLAFLNVGGPEVLSMLPTGQVGIGSSTPWGLFSINPNGITGPVFAIGSSSNTLYRLDSSGSATSTNAFGVATFVINAGSTTGPILTVQATSSMISLFSVDQYGHLQASTTPVAPSLTSCGTSPSLSADSNDTYGTITVGSVAATACTFVFGVPHTIGTHCVISEQTGSVVNVASYTESLAGFTYSQTGLTSDKLDYICWGQ